MSQLAEKQCIPCTGGIPPLSKEEVKKLLIQIPGWEVINEHHLSRTIRRPDFKSALTLVNSIGRIAEEENHHPDIQLAWGRVQVDIWTHKIDGLTESDFILAAKISGAIN